MSSVEGRTSRVAAQQRADRIAAFRAELAELEREGVPALSAERRVAVEAHQDALLSALAARFEVDVSEAEKQLSLGMRAASLLGALALGASVYFYFRHFWGLISTPVQVAILVAAPVLGLIATDFAARRERSGYFAALFGLVTFTCFVLDLSMLGATFNVTPSDAAFLAWSGFAMLLAYTYGMRLLLVAGILSFVAFIAARAGTIGGLYWLDFGERPENFILAGLLLFAVPVLLPHRRLADFSPLYRIFGLLVVLLPILVLANYGRASYLSWDPGRIEGAYQAAGFVLCAAAIWTGIHRRWPDTVNVGVTFFVVFLYTKFYDWWWELLPKYSFFLLIGLTAVLALWLLKKLRRAAAPLLKPEVERAP